MRPLIENIGLLELASVRALRCSGCRRDRLSIHAVKRVGNVRLYQSKPSSPGVARLPSSIDDDALDPPGVDHPSQGERSTQLKAASYLQEMYTRCVDDSHHRSAALMPSIWGCSTSFSL